MKFLLVNPPPYQVIEPYYDQPDFPRTSLACLAAYLRENSIEVEVLDCKHERLGNEQAVDFIEKSNPDMVGFTAMTNEIKPAARLAEMVKEKWPDKITMIGGVHVTALPEQTLNEFPSFDYGVTGEGELTLMRLIEAIQNNKKIDIPGVCFRKNNKVMLAEGAPERPADLSALPAPAWDMFRPSKEYYLQTLRGCPYRCNFCMNPNGRNVRARTPEQMVEEVRFIHEYANPEMICFGDEIFPVKRERVMGFCELLIAQGLHKKVKWECQTHVNFIDSEMVELMERAGCDRVGLGVETADEDVLRNMGKGANLQKIMNAVQILKKARMKFKSFIILGQPDETYESAKKTIDFAIKINATYPIFGVMVPYPGTEVGAMMQRGEGGYVLKSKDWNNFNKQLGDAVTYRGISRAQIEKLQFWGYIKVFLYNFRIFDLLIFFYKYRKEGMMLFKKIFFSSKKKGPEPAA